ncbi:MAG: DnaA N-terminal domain-containing protein, partial [Acidimicrobiales bacterium]
MTDTQRLWQESTSTIREQLTEAVWRNTFGDVHVVAGEPGELVLEVPSSFLRDRIDNRFRSLVRDTVDGAGGAEYAIRLQVAPPEEGDDVAEVDPPVETTAHLDASDEQQRNTPAIDAGPPHRNGQTALNEDFTFEAFVIGETNRFA